VTVVATQNQIAAQLHAWKLLPEPERLTELYFTNQPALPTTYLPGDVQAVAFSVHNLEQTSTRYSYVISQLNEKGDQTVVLARGNFTLGKNHYKAATVPVILTDLGSRSLVRVALTNTDDTISYWNEKGGV